MSKRFQGLFASIYVMLMWLLCTLSKHNFNSPNMSQYMPLSTCWLVSSLSNSKRRLKEPHTTKPTMPWSRVHVPVADDECAPDDTNIHEDSRMPTTIKRPLLPHCSIIVQLSSLHGFFCDAGSIAPLHGQSQKNCSDVLPACSAEQWWIEYSENLAAGDGSGEKTYATRSSPQ